MRVLCALVFLVFFTLCCASCATETGSLSVPKVGNYYYWFAYKGSNGSDTVTPPRLFKEQKTTIDLPLVKDEVPNCKLFVLDARTGNEAVLDISAKPKAPVEFRLTSDDFIHLRKVQILVTSTSQDAPVAAGTVTLRDEKNSARVQVLDPFAKGIVEFTDVPIGPVEVTVASGEASATQRLTLSADREDQIPLIEVSVSGNVPTVKVDTNSTADKTSKTQEQPPAGRTRRGIDFPMVLVGLVIIVVIVYAAIRVMHRSGRDFKRIMEKMGIDLPDESRPASPAQPSSFEPVDPSVCPFCGTKKDTVTGVCACSVGSSPAAGTQASSGPRMVVTQGPHLGSIFALEGETVTIGRDPSNTIALSQDSTVSRRHARIIRSDGEYTIVDEGSSNGTFVNGVRVTTSSVRFGDEIQVGNTKLRFEA